jgi:HNH endonuclease
VDSTEPLCKRQSRKPNDTCDLPGCDAPFVARGMCRKHYTAWQRATPKDQRPPAPGLSRLTVEERFYSKVTQADPAACWPWTGSTHRSGHGVFFVSKERGTVPAHAFALELATGEARPEGLETCHHCDNPPCCNPAHLYYGTRQQNVDDMWRRERGRRGSAHRDALLTEKSVVEIRQRYAAGEFAKDLASEFNVTIGTVVAVVLGKNWRHVGGPIQTPGAPRPWRKNNQRRAA